MPDFTAAELESWYLDLKDEGKEFGLPPRFRSRRGHTQTRNPRTRLGREKGNLMYCTAEAGEVDGNINGPD